MTAHSLSYDAGLIVVRSGGDLGTGVVQKFWRAGFRVLVLEKAQPLTIRRTVALAEAVTLGEWQVEDMLARRIGAPEQASQQWVLGAIPVLVDANAACLPAMRPVAVVDAILAKRNMGTHPAMAPITIALGPGYHAPTDVDAVVETMRGHDLGRVIVSGSAAPNTGIPGELGGKTHERVLYAPTNGVIQHGRRIGEVVAAGETIFHVGNIAVKSTIQGIVRGIAASGITVPKGMKCADIDPRPVSTVNCADISDKARCVGGGALEACFAVAYAKGIALRPGR